MPAIRRATDEPNEDHFHNGDRETDWRKNTPRSALIVVIYMLLGALSFLGTFSYHALMKELNDVRTEVRDQRWDVLSEQARDLGALKEQARQDAAWRDEIRREFDRLNLRLSKKGL